jgi:hypothetical protein
MLWILEAELSEVHHHLEDMALPQGFPVEQQIPIDLVLPITILDQLQLIPIFEQHLSLNIGPQLWILPVSLKEEMACL